LAEAVAASNRAAELERSALAKPASMGRVRGDLGGVSTIRKLWTGEVVNRAELDLEALRQHLPEEGLAQAVRAFAKANGIDGKPAPVLRGARIYQKNV
jgi:plasmid stabilization system protein ParE